MAISSSRHGDVATLLLSILTLSSCAILPQSASSYRGLPAKRDVKKTTIPLTSDGGFWFADVSVGEASSLSLLVDTGSANVVVNAGKYKPSAKSVDLAEPFTVAYGTAESNGTGSATINGTMYEDTVALQGLTVENQTLGAANDSDSSTTYPHDGIIGLGAQLFAANNATSFFHNLCEKSLVEECRFGIALDDAQNGSIVIGALDADLLDGDLTSSPIAEEWFTLGDVVVAGQTLEKDAVIEFDSGSATTVGPTDVVAKLLTELGAQVSTQDTPDGPVVTGSMACSTTNSPPVGFRFPSTNITSMDSSIVARTFNISLEGLLVPSLNASDPNCTVAVLGQDFAELPGLWVLGQNFLHGKYIDHNLDDRTIGLAALKSSGGNSSSSESGSGSSTPSGSGAASNSASSSTSSSARFLFAVYGLIAVYFGFGSL